MKKLKTFIPFNFIRTYQRKILVFNLGKIQSRIKSVFSFENDVILKIGCFIFLIQPSHSKVNTILSTLGSLAVEAIDKGTRKLVPIIVCERLGIKSQTSKFVLLFFSVIF